MMRIPTIEIKRLDGKLIKVNRKDRFLYAKMGCDMDPHGLRKNTSGGEPIAEQVSEEPKESTPTDETAPTTMKRKMIIQPKPIDPKMTPMPRTPVQENLNDLLVD